MQRYNVRSLPMPNWVERDYFFLLSIHPATEKTRSDGGNTVQRNILLIYIGLYRVAQEKSKLGLARPILLQ